MDGRLEHWSEIATYLGKDIRTAQRYAKFRGMPVYRYLNSGPRPRVYAFKAEIDTWRFGEAVPRITAEPDIAQLILERVSELSNAKALYRKNFVVRFSLMARGPGIEALIETDYEIVNESNARQPYVQEVTIDDCERGQVELMTVLVDGRPIALLKKPVIAKQHQGYASYQGPRLMIEPSSSGKHYTGRAVWTVKRRDNDFWYLHSGIPTLGIKVETAAPPEFEITPAYSSPGLLTIGQHLDITWKRKPRKR